MAQAGGTVIYQQEGTEAGASGDDLGAPFSLPVLSKSALTHHPQAGGGTACGSCALSEGRPVGPLPCPAWTGQQTPTAACASDEATPMHWRFGSVSHQQARAGYIPAHCLPRHVYG